MRQKEEPMSFEQFVQKGALMPAAAAAAPGGTFQCTALAVGPNMNGHVYVWLRELGNGAFNNWYVVDDTCKKEMLATALVAITNNLQLLVELSTTDGYGSVRRMYVNRF